MYKNIDVNCYTRSQVPGSSLIQYPSTQRYCDEHGR